MSAWKHTAIERSKVITEAWAVAIAYAGRAAQIVLFICLIFNLLEVFSILPFWFANGVLIAQSIILDVAGFGLTTMGKHAQQKGNEGAARKAGLMGWTLIGLMIVTVTLVTLPLLFPETKDAVSWIDKVLILARVVITVFYGHIVHSLEEEDAAYENRVSSLQAEVDRLKKQLDTGQKEVSSLRVQVSSVQSKMQAEVDALRVQLDGKQRELDTLRVQVDSEQSVLQAQLDGKQKELDTLRKQLESGQEWQSGRVSSLQAQLNEKQQELESVQSALSSEQQMVSSLRHQLDSLKVSTEQVSTKKLDTGHSRQLDTGRVSTGQGKVVQLDTGRRKSGQDESDLAEQIRQLLIVEPGLSARAIAARLNISPTTASKHKSDIEKKEFTA